MRRTLTALVLLSATLFILQSLPSSDTTVVQQSSTGSGTVEEWVQTSLTDFQSGELECTTVIPYDDGGITLAQVAEGQYCDGGTFVSPVHQASVLFNAIGAAWLVEKPMGTAFQVEVRASHDGTAWTDWMEVYPDEDGPETEGMVYGNLVEVPPSRYLQYRLSLATFEASASPTVQELIFTIMNTMEGPTTEEARAMILPQEVTSGVPQPRIISRKGWGATESWATREPGYRRPVTFVIHHTVTTNNPQNPAAIVRAILRYHAISRGWGDIGYNFLIDRQGNIYEGRKGGDGVVGVHAGRYNYGSIGIALLGDYRSAQMTPAMKEALLSLMAWEADRFGIHPLESSHFIDRDLPHVLGHRDVMATVCPGDQVYRLLPELRKQTWQRLLAHDPRVIIESPEAGEAVSGEVVVRVSSPSPTTARTRLLLDGTPQAEDASSVAWSWNTRESSEGLHRIEAVARSIQGRKSSVVQEVTVDNTPPTGSLLINDGTSYALQVTVTLSLEADDVQGQVAGMQFTQDSASQFSDAEEFAATKEWVLGAGDGQKTIGVRFLDSAGNASPVYTATVTLDGQAPDGWSLLEMGATGRVVVAVSDDGSGLEPLSGAYSLSSDGGNTWGPWRPTSCDTREGEASLRTCHLLGQLADGVIRFKMADRAGNEGYSPIYGETTSPTRPPDTGPTATPTGDGPVDMLPDLLVEDVVVEPEIVHESGSITVAVSIINDAGVDVQQGFWVELFVDPQTLPSINSVAGQGGPGAFWYVPCLGAHETLTLTEEAADTRYTTFEGDLPAGRHEIYAYVDAYNSEGEVGLVSELDETNNLLGPVTVDIGPASADTPDIPAGFRPGQVVRLFLEGIERLLAQLRLYARSS